MDLQEKRQLELASQVARVRARARPWRAISAFILAVAAAVVSWISREEFRRWTVAGHLPAKIVCAAATAGFCVLAVIAMLGFSGKVRDILLPVTGRSHAAVARYSMVLAGSVTILIVTLGLLRVPIGQLIVGGAFTTILIGIAAQQSLANVFAGMVLLLSRPFVVGDPVRLRSGSLGGIIEGTVTEIGITYLRLETAEGVLLLPNSQVLAAGVGALRHPGADGGGPAAPAP